MPKVSEMIDSKYLKQSDVPTDVNVTIEAVAKKNVAREGDEPEMKWLIKFAEFRKPMVLNTTNIKRIQRACNSDNTDDWKGKTIVLYVDPDVEFGGNVVGGLRVRATAAAAGKPAGKFTDMEDDIPF
jgi:hypothetical protein